MKKIIALLAVVFALILYMVVDASNEQAKASEGTADQYTDAVAAETKVDVPEDKNPVATIKLAGYDEMQFELYPMVAPQSVYNFIDLANSGFYDGLIMHRLVTDFVIQGGDPDGTGTGGPGYGIKGEFASNGIKNDLKHKKGALAMARSGEPDSAGSQFYVTLADANNLDGDYAVFGEMTKGEEVLDELNKLKTGENDKPEKEIKIEKVSVDTKGIDYPKADQIK